jgi:hypothetical protein
MAKVNFSDNVDEMTIEVNVIGQDSEATVDVKTEKDFEIISIKQLTINQAKHLSMVIEKALKQFEGKK